MAQAVEDPLFGTPRDYARTFLSARIGYVDRASLVR